MVQLQGNTSPNIDQLKLITKLGDEINLTPLLVELNLYEDLYSPVLTGTITFDDRVGLFDNVPLSGKEKLVYKIYSWNYSEENSKVNFLHRTFDIIKITDITQVTDYTKRLTLHFASPELIRNETLKISKGYSNVRLSEVVEDIVTSDYDVGEQSKASTGLGFAGEEVSNIENNFYSPYLFSENFETRLEKTSDNESLELFIEKTKYTEPQVSFPYMKPFDIINWIASRSFRRASGRYGTKNENAAANFLFFENKRGLNFISLETLLESKEYSTTQFEYGSGKQNHHGKSRKVHTETIRNLQIQSCFDILSNIRNGVYASKLFSYDISTGTYKEFDYDYVEEFYNSESMERTAKENDFPIIAVNDGDLSHRFLSKRLFVLNTPERTLDNITSEMTGRINDKTAFSGAENYLQKRISQLGRLNNFRLLLEIGGNTKHKVGDIVSLNLKVPIYKNNDQQDFSEEVNKFYSGNYLITSIRHTINKDEYTMFLEVVKDSHNKAIRLDN